jgi:hypothetical protein
MPGGDDHEPEGVVDPPEPEPPDPLQRSSEQLTRPGQQLTPLNYNAEHQQRMNEAAVRERETHATQVEENRELRKRIANQVSLAVALQVAIADAAFLTYGFWNHWNIPGSTMIAWLSSTVVQVIAVGLVVTKSLFPSASDPE